MGRGKFCKFTSLFLHNCWQSDPTQQIPAVGGSAKSYSQRTNNYLSNFEIIEDEDEYSLEDFNKASDDEEEISLKELEGRARQSGAHIEENSHTDDLDNEIEDIDSDDDRFQGEVTEPPQIIQNSGGRVPGLQLGGPGGAIGPLSNLPNPLPVPSFHLPLGNLGSG
jgi:hypothetical protein